MSVDKRVMYEMQGGNMPARNYLGKQKTVSDVPVKWQSGPNTPPTELAYITDAEKDLILKANLHGSLTDGPNTGPDGIMSLDSQGDYTRDRSTGAYDSGPAGSGGGNTQQDLRNRAMNEQHMKDILTGQKNIGQTVQTGPRTRQYSDLPEYMKVLQPDGTYKDTYVGSAYKSYGQPSFFGNLFSRGAPGYRGIRGLSAWGDPMRNYSLNMTGPAGPGYYTDKTNFTEMRGALPPIGIMGILSNIMNRVRPPKDMSKFNKLSLTKPEDQKVYMPEGMDVPMDRNIPGFNWTDVVADDKFNYEFDVNDVASLIEASKQPQGIVFNNPVGGLDQFAREMEALEASIPRRPGQTEDISMRIRPKDMTGTLRDFYTNKGQTVTLADGRVVPTTEDTLFQVYDDNIDFNDGSSQETDENVSWWDSFINSPWPRN